MQTLELTSFDPALKTRWVEALRSGEYTQGHGVLRSHNDTYCCLGVLCDLVDPDGWRQDAEDEPYGHRESFGYPSSGLLRDVGLPIPEGNDNFTDTLVARNDNLLHTFPMIADWIEANL